jgi:hypothetical protein
LRDITELLFTFLGANLDLGAGNEELPAVQLTELHGNPAAFLARTETGLLRRHAYKTSHWPALSTPDWGNSTRRSAMTKPHVRLNKDDAAVLLVDQQAGLLSLVRDINPDTFRNNVLALAELARYFELPTVLTTSFESGPNGPFTTELKETFPEAPYIARPGQINACDSDEFVQAVKGGSSGCWSSRAQWDLCSAILFQPGSRSGETAGRAWRRVARSR